MSLFWVFQIWTFVIFRYRARKELQGLRVERRREELEKAARVLQGFWRTRICKIQLQQKKQSLIKIQSVIRCFVAKRRYLRIRNAVILLQRRFRVRYLGESYRKQFLAMKSASVRIQAVWRGFMTRKEAKTRRDAVTKLQAELRRVLVRRRYVKLKKTVVLLQSVYRAKIVSRIVRSWYIEQRKSCIKIQFAKSL